MGELRGNRSVDGDATDRAVCDAGQQGAEAVDIHGLGEDILHDLGHQRVVGDFDVALDIFLAGSDVGEDGGEEIVGAHALNLKGNLFAAAEAQQGQGALGVPAPAGGEDWRIQSGLFENWLDAFGVEILEDVGQGETVLFGQGNVEA